MSFTVKLNGQSISFEKKIKLLDLTNGNKEIICAVVNGITRELDYDLYYDADLNFLTVKDHGAMEIYERSIRYLFALAAHKVYPDLRFKLTYSISRSIFAQIISKKGEKKKYFLTGEMVQNIEDKMREIASLDLPFQRIIKTNEEAKEIYEKFNLTDKKSNP
jgi:uridine kinase